MPVVLQKPPHSSKTLVKQQQAFGRLNKLNYVDFANDLTGYRLGWKD